MPKDGSRFTIETTSTKSLLALLAKLKPLRDEDFPPIADLPPEPVEL